MLPNWGTSCTDSMTGMRFSEKWAARSGRLISLSTTLFLLNLEYYSATSSRSLVRALASTSSADLRFKASFCASLRGLTLSSGSAKI